jgi:hypothetical protein
VDESSVRFEEREVILLMLMRQALEWSSRPAKLAVLRQVIARIANHEHLVEIAARTRRVQAELRGVALREGERFARAFFAKRGDRAEAHLSESELAAALTTAYELGFEQGYVRGAVLVDPEETSSHARGG